MSFGSIVLAYDSCGLTTAELHQGADDVVQSSWSREICDVGESPNGAVSHEQHMPYGGAQSSCLCIYVQERELYSSVAP
jgi:hypothetical protein